MHELEHFQIASNDVDASKLNQIINKKAQDTHSSRFACAEVRKHLPQDLLSKVTMLLQDSGYVTISPRELSIFDWRIMNDHVKQMGGVWVSNDRFSHWSIPFSRTR
jgi:hypothetical protein